MRSHLLVLTLALLPATASALQPDRPSRRPGAAVGSLRPRPVLTPDDLQERLAEEMASISEAIDSAPDERGPDGETRRMVDRATRRRDLAKSALSDGNHRGAHRNLTAARALLAVTKEVELDGGDRATALERMERVHGLSARATRFADLSGLVLEEAELSRARGAELTGEESWEGATLALAHAEALYRVALRERERLAARHDTVDKLAELEDNIEKLKRAGGPDDLLYAALQNLHRAKEAVGQGRAVEARRHASVAHRLTERAARAVRAGSAAASDPVDDPLRPPPPRRDALSPTPGPSPPTSDPLERLDSLLRRAGAAVDRTPREEELLAKARRHAKEAEAHHAAGREEEATESAALGIRLTLRLLEEKGAVDSPSASRTLDRLDELLVVAEERVEGLDSDAAAVRLLDRARERRAEARAALLAGDLAAVERSAGTAQDLLFEVLALTR